MSRTNMRFLYGSLLLACGAQPGILAFVPHEVTATRSYGISLADTKVSASKNEDLVLQKQALFNLLQREPRADPILADPITKEPLTITTKSTVWIGSAETTTRFELQSPSNRFQGTSDTFLDLLEPVVSDKTNLTDDSVVGAFATQIARTFTPFIPPPLRSALAMAGVDDYIPMRDLFTSPSVSFAYERGWRQGFASAGFPGPDQEASLAMTYFEPCVARSDLPTLVDMSCATGLFTRRFVSSGRYRRVLGCDYSEAMLKEAQRRIRLEKAKMLNSKTKLDLIRCDVGQIPLQSNTIDALHAGAAMHCWPDLPAAISEIHRVLKPGGRYFATTFLSSYFRTLQRMDNTVSPTNSAFQYFGSIDQLRKLLIEGGFPADKVMIEILGNACVVIRCEK